RLFVFYLLRLGAGGYQGLARLVGGILGEVLHKARGQILGFGIPLAGVRVGVPGVQDGGVHTGKSGGHLKVEVGDGLGGSSQNRAVQNGVDNAAGILDGDAPAGAVPAGVHQVGLGTGLLHLLYQLLAILGGMQLQEGLAEAGGEGGSGLGDAPLGAGQLGGEAGQEVVLGLLRGQDGNRGQHAKGVGGQEDHILGVGSGGHGSHDLLDVVDGIGNAGVLSDGVVGEVAVAVLVHSHVLQQGVALDGVVDVGLGVLVQVDDLGVAAALKVEYAVVIPAVLIVADEQAFGVGGQ
ncbi:DUF4367 domain-containing protein, partial [Dysosmobacter welbionis]